MGRTSGVPIPLTLNLMGKHFKLREFVVSMVLESEKRPLSKKDGDRIIEVTRALRNEFSECWKIRKGTDHCTGIRRAARMLINLLKQHPIRGRNTEIEDQKRWLEYGRKL